MTTTISRREAGLLKTIYQQRLDQLRNQLAPTGFKAWSGDELEIANSLADRGYLTRNTTPDDVPPHFSITTRGIIYCLMSQTK